MTAVAALGWVRPAVAAPPAAGKLREGETVPCAGRHIDRVLLSGCAETRCADPDEGAALVASTGITGDAPWDAAVERRAVARLVETRFFHTVTPRCELRAGETVLVFDVRGNLVVREVTITGYAHFYESDIRKRVFLRRGTVLDGREAEREKDRKRQAESITRLYAREGFSSASVKVFEDPQEGGELTLRIVIDEGEKDRVGSVAVTMARKARASAAAACPQLSSSLIRSAATLGPGDVYTEARRRRVQRRVKALLRSLGYVGPRVEAGYERETQTLSIDVWVGSCYDIGVYLRDAADGHSGGYRRVSDEALYEELPFAESGAFDEDEAELGRQALEHAYEARGYLFADVRLEYRAYDERGAGGEGPPPDLAGAIHYYVTEDSVTELRGIFFHGAQAFDASTIRGWMETRVYDFFDEGGFLQVQRLLWDLETVVKRYRAAGYLQFRFAGCPSEALRGDAWESRRTGWADEDDVREARLWRRVRRHAHWTLVDYAYGELCFTVAREAGEGTVYVRAAVEEGPQSTVERVRLEGNVQLATPVLEAALALPPGAPFSASLVEKATTRVQRLYHRHGIYPIDISVTC